ncbi:branched-chain amino acid ABC transporter ATP-binding protein/permease [Paractinoplanes globisporus]|uniref:ATP-binding cassette domain-containing protein n=1 Tax=Paractinoplanes globisporus TaxID=113565 RepID=A0ABW6W9A8_9ACTN|nr:ATP-binding cassette domain-containing protein [Actinoplanes globisporus]
MSRAALTATRLRPLRPALPIVVLLAAMAAPYFGMSLYAARTVMLICGLALLVSSINIVLGYAGELAVGQVALYATGAYVAGYLGSAHGVTEILIVIPIAILVVIVIGLVTGIPGLRLGGWSLAMVTFFLVLLLPDFINVFEHFTAGTLGISVPAPTLFGSTITGTNFYFLTLLVTALWFAVFRNLVLSRHGAAFLVLKHSPVLAASLGISVFRLKLLAYLFGAIPAALAGVLYGWLQNFIAPDTFTFQLALSILAASVIGGSTSIYGAFIGAALLQITQQEFTSFNQWQLVLYGAFLILAGVFLYNGVIGAGRQLAGVLRRRGWWPTVTLPVRTEVAPPPAAEENELPGEELAVQGVSKSFGGNRALDDVSVTAKPGEVTAVIGPNGSGKTTLLNLVCGFYRPTSGTISLGSRTLAGLASYQVARAGVARTFQTPLIPKDLTTRQFVATGRYIGESAGMAASILRLPGYFRRTRADDAEAGRLLGLLGIGHVAEDPVSSLPLGTRRLVEVARCLAARPSLFLFDEVGSGLDESDLDRLADAIRMIKRAGGTVVLVEHNFPLVLKLSDTIHVLAQGRLLASGTPDEIQADPRVLEEYVGSTPSAEGPSSIDDFAEPALSQTEER